jgi:hypothetical protein
VDAPSIAAIKRLVSTQRSALMQEVTQQLALYGVQPNGTILPESSLQHLSDHQRRIARQIRQTVQHRISSMKPADAFTTVVREQAFTALNRIVAIRMAEVRGVIPPAVSAGLDSEGFQVYLLSLGSSALPRYEWYQEYLNAVLDELSMELPVLFDRFRSDGIIVPREQAFMALLAAVSAPELADVWAQDETLGWIYEFFNDPAERKKMREKSSISSSYELAVRNQFFTPRYVVEFLVDNSLGRLWTEITGDRDALADTAQMLSIGPEDDLTPQQPRSPRDLRVIDPACGSMHFGLYAFDLLAEIYLDAWRRGMLGTAEEDALADEAALRAEIPRYIIEDNLMGIDIDRRAVQIAGLTLWLRAHRWWHDYGITIDARPRLSRVRLATAQPMPGEDQFFEEFVAGLEPPVLGEIARKVREELNLAGVAGSLLKVEGTAERAIAAIRKAKHEYMKREAGQGGLFPEQHRERLSATYGADITSFDGNWEELETRLDAALREYIRGHATDAAAYQRSLFADDTEAGLAFVDLLRERYDVVLMNPPFGESAKDAKKYIETHYPRTRNDLYAAFTESFLHRLKPGGYLAAITSRTGFFLSTYKKWREEVLLQDGEPVVMADLGFGVLNAMVETAAYVVRNIGLPNR